MKERVNIYRVGHIAKINQMVLCGCNCRCEYCYLIKVYQHPRFKRDIQNMIEMYKLMADPNYFPIEVEREEKRVPP